LDRRDFVLLFLAALLAVGLPSSGVCLGDTLTVIQRPLLNIPSIVRPGDTLSIECEADEATSGWAVALARDGRTLPLPVIDSFYDPTTLWWRIDALVPAVAIYDLYDLIVRADGLADTTRHAVKVISEFKHDYYFIHITDTHLPTHLYYYQDGAATDTSEMVDFREVIRDVNIINPEFVLLTGDLVNEGELENYLGKHYLSRAQRMLEEFEVPVYLTSGNHDIGGWRATPPPDGTARMNWWRFFGWKRLMNPPSGAPSYTQDYSFDYGQVHFVGLEAYINYDGWRSHVYGGQSFTSQQLQWLVDDLAQSSAPTRVLFYHCDFSNQIHLSRLGVDMALSGHIHRDADDFSPPYDIVTNNVCDGERSYRLIRVSGDRLHPTRTISAGYDGRNLDVTFEPANDGSNYTVVATITNRLNERFEHAMIRFHMPNERGNADVDGGNLMQIDPNGKYAIWYVQVDIPPSSENTVTARLEATPSSPPIVEVLQPNGGEVWNIDSSYEIIWDAEDDISVASIDILLSADGGISFADTIASGIANSGSYLWKVSPLPTWAARIKIIARDNEGNSGEDTSDNDFAMVDITPPLVHLIEPQGGESWAIDSTYTIAWSATDNVGVASVTILLSRDAGLTYPETLTVDEANDGNYSWTPEGNPTCNARIAILAVDGSGNVGTDASQTDFEIYDPTGGHGTDLPAGVVIKSTAPNPFSDRIDIEFGIPREGRVRVWLYDVTGRRITSIAERNFRSGYHHITWLPDASIKAGIYFVRVEIDNQAATYKIVRRLKNH